MRMPFKPGLLIATLALAGCSAKDGGEAIAPAGRNTPVGAANAEFARLEAQGPEATAREITKIEYPLTRDLMKAGGLDAALGGEAKASEALDRLFVLYEQKARAFETGLQTLFDKRSGGGGGGGFGSGGSAGTSGMGASSTTSGIQNEMAQQAWERAQEEGQSSGSHTTESSGGSARVDWTPDGYTSTTTFEGNLPEGLKGKVTTKVKSVACPDAQGKVEVEFESTSDLSAGDGSAQTKVSSKLVKHLDDDANLIDEDMDSDTHVEQSTGSGSHVDVTDTLSTSRGEVGSKVNGRNRSASDEDVQLAQGLAKMGRFAAWQALTAAKKTWESGKCVKLEVRSDPAKRTGAKPNTAYTLFAEPRAKSDGAPTRGTVKATLSGEHMLNPRDKKVPADAKFDYQNPEKKDQSASIDFEARSKRGVGKATLEFDTKEGKAYRITGVGQCTESHEVCDVSKPFTFSMCGGTMTHKPSSATGGSHSFEHSGAHGSGSYTLSGPEEEMTATYQNTTCALGKCFKTPNGKSIWTRIESCE